MNDDGKKLEVARAIEEFEREKLTGKIEIDFKVGQLVSGRKLVSFLK